MSDDVDRSDWVSLKIEAPIPMSVMGPLMSIIPDLWPDSVLVTTDDRRYAVSALLPPGPARQVSDEAREQALVRRDEEGGELEFLGFSAGQVAFAPPEELCLALGNFAHSIFIGIEGAVNHVEWEVRTGNDPEDSSYVLSISASPEQTPLAMRLKAEASLDYAKQHIAKLERALKRAGINPDDL